MSLASSIVPSWIRGSDPLNGLFVVRRIENFQSSLSNNPNYISDMIDKYFLNNNHRMHLLMVPDKHYSDNIANEESLLLKSKLKSVDKEEIEKQNEELSRKQSEKQDASLLPCLAQKDIDPKYADVTWEKSMHDLPIKYRNANECNGLSFVKSFFPFKPLSTSSISILPLVSRVANEIGIKSIPIDEFTEQIKSTSGGISIGTQLICKKDQSLGLFSSISSYSLDSKLSPTYDLVAKM